MAPAIVSAVEVGLKLIDKYFPSQAEKDAAKLKLYELNQAGEFKEIDSLLASDKNQTDINLEEAKSESLFKSGWRPAAGWACVGGLVYQLLVRPIGSWVMTNAFGWTPMPSLEMDTLLTLLFGMLGLGYYRTREKLKQ